MGTLTWAQVKKKLPFDLYELIGQKKLEKEARVNFIKIVCEKPQPTLKDIFDIRERLVKGEVSFKEYRDLLDYVRKTRNIILAKAIVKAIDERIETFDEHTRNLFYVDHEVKLHQDSIGNFFTSRAKQHDCKVCASKTTNKYHMLHHLFGWDDKPVNEKRLKELNHIWKLEQEYRVIFPRMFEENDHYLATWIPTRDCFKDV